jgi:glycosyltransferase involved in cell wall biosynthesis
MFSGTPAIVSDIPPNLETIDSSMAGIIPRGDVNKLASAMKDSIMHYPLYKEKASKALAHALSRFDIKKVAEAHEQLYHEIVTHGK